MPFSANVTSWRFVFRLLLVIATTTIAGNTFAKESSMGTITVQGESRKLVQPDQVMIMIGIEHRDQDLSQAQNNNNMAVRQVLKVIKEFKIDERDVQTTYVHLSPQVQHQYPGRGEQEDKPVLYLARKEMGILLKDIQRYESLMSALLQSGVNQIQQISFLHSKEEQLREEARRQALRNAKEKAQSMAKELGSQIGATKSIQEGGLRHSSPVPLAFKTMESRSMMDEGGAMTLALGEIAIESNVIVSFYLK
ncbi:MAG: SIMPL domain-containing protein [Oligoflexus sp.]